MISPSSFPPAMLSTLAGKAPPDVAPKLAEPATVAPPVADTAAPVPTTGGLPPVDSSHNTVLWPDQIDPVAVHAAVLIAQEAYRNQKALEGLAMLVQVPSGPKSDGPIATRPGARGEVRPPTRGEFGGEGGARR